MESIPIKDTLKFMSLINNLKHSSRRGWELREVKNHEQIASHMYSMGMVTFLLGDNSSLDRLKCLQLALVHDLAECIVGDITPMDNISEEHKHKMEDEAMKEITSNLGSEVGALIYSLYKEPKTRPKRSLSKTWTDLICCSVHRFMRNVMALRGNFRSFSTIPKASLIIHM